MAMVNVTVSVPAIMKDKMDEFSEINWSEVARRAFMQKIGDLEFLKQLKSKSKLSEKDALELGRKVNEALAKKYETG